MRIWMALCLAATALPAGAAAQQRGPAEPVTVEHYYRIKWGRADEFKRLYKPTTRRCSTR